MTDKNPLYLMLVVKTWFHQERGQIWIKNTLKTAVSFSPTRFLDITNVSMCCAPLLYPSPGVDLSQSQDCAALHAAENRKQHHGPGNPHVKTPATQGSCIRAPAAPQPTLYWSQFSCILGQTCHVAFLWVGDMTFSWVFHAKSFVLHIVKDE